jgi:hypothetical protein
MTRLPLPFTDAELSLAPRWSVGGGLVALVALALIVRLYRYEMRIVSRRIAAALLTLRIGLVLLLALVVFAQPSLARTSSEQQARHVLVFMDRTASMEVSDPQRPAVEKIKLARALQLARDLASDLQLDEWIYQYRLPDGPQWVAADEFKDDVVRRRQLVEERRRLHDQVCKRVDELTRTEICRRLLGDDIGFSKRLSSTHDVILFGFADGIWHSDADRLEELFSRKTSDHATARGGAFTDLGLPLDTALEQPDSQAVILFTDGRHNRGEPPANRAEKLGERKTPIYSIALGSRQAGPDVAIVGLETPNAVFKNAEGNEQTNTNIKATLRVHGLPAQEITVELLGLGRVLEQRRIVHDGTDRDYPLSFAATMNEEGTQKLTVTARPAGDAGHAANRSRSALVKVVEDKADILLIDGEARWEQHYLAVALGRDPMVNKVQSVIFTQPRLGRIDEVDLRKVNHPALTMPTEPDALSAYDIIVLGDVSPEQFSLEERKRLEKYVGERGGTLVILAGKRSMPMEFVSAKPQAAEGSDPLTKLLPITEPHIVKPSDGFGIDLTDEGKRTPLMQLGDGGENNDVWSDLPPHYWGVVGQPKPAATVLARQEGGALVAWQPYGQGRVLFVGIDSTWRWRYKTGDKYHHRFWGQLARWAAADKLLEGGTSQVRYGTPRAMYQTGQEIDVLMRLSEEIPAELPKGPARARIFREGAKNDTVAVVELARREGQPRVLQGKVRDLPDGQYRMELDVPELADRLQPPTAPGAIKPRAAEFQISPPDSRELLELTTDWDLLNDLAEKSGGKVYAPEDAGQLLDLLTSQAQTRIERNEHHLWEWWPTLAVVLVLLTGEWMIRKWVGLP